ncbi:MAG TPA: SRPBCC domain-containing protein [Chitinophagaceae bacterium]|nr:SRPBCC domain-containing protein [Chitinophagaceae bacterium]
MEKLHFNVSIKAPAAKVFHTVTDDKLYREWTAEFNPTSSFEGSWDKGAKIRFVGISENGKREGMVANIVENIPNKQISIKHLGLVSDDKEITEGPLVDGWANAMEEYFLEERNGMTTFKVAVDCKEDFKDYFEKTWPKALNKLKEVAER